MIFRFVFNLKQQAILYIFIYRYAETYSKIYDHSSYTQTVTKKNLLFFSLSLRMSGKNVNFGDKKILKKDFCKNKKVTNIDDIDANKTLVSKEEPCGTKKSFKCFIRYNDNDLIRPLCIKLPQMTGYVRNFEGNTTISFKISDKQLLKKYNQIWKRVEKLLKIDSKPVYGDNDK